MIDERRGKPSASKMGRIVGCPASHSMEMEAERLYPDKRDDKDANAGELVHAILSDDAELEDVTYSAELIAERCEEQLGRLLADWTDAFPSPFMDKVWGTREIRLGLTSLNTVLQVTPESRADFIFTGKYDRLYVAHLENGEVHGFLADFKALYGPHAAAIENPQLASLAVLVSKRHKLTSLRVAVVQPMKGRPTIADYAEGGLHLAESWLAEALLKESQSTPADRRKGSWCHHCRARFGCDVFLDAAVSVMEPLNYMNIAGLDGEAQRKALFARAMEMTPERHTALYLGSPMLKRAHEAITASFKARVEAGDIPGYGLREKKGRRSISDVVTVFARAAAHGVTPEDFTTECSLPLGSLSGLLRKSTGKKGKALEAVAAECLDGCTNTSKPSFEVAPLNLEGGFQC